MSTAQQHRDARPPRNDLHQDRAAARERRRRRAAAAADPRTATSDLLQLATRHPWTKSLMMSNPSAPPQVLAELAVLGAADVRRAVAYNPASPPVLLHHLRADPESAVATAARRQIDARALPAFARVSRWSIQDRLDAAADPTTDPDDLAVLAFNERAVREAVASNPAATPKILAHLARDPKRSVRRAVAAHPDTDPAVLAVLAGDEDRYVRLALAQRPSLAPELSALVARDPRSTVRALIAARRELGPDVIALLERDRSVLVRRRIAAHPALPPEAAERLSQDPDPAVRSASRAPRA